jgi:aromatic ring-opening dioxygenase catalytic subunit (LigB family)
MDYDYHGFPEHTYRIQYNAPGSPALAQHVRELLAQGGIEAGEDPARGFDHGTFVPLALMYPDADVPIVLLSLKSGYDPAEHIALGKALETLRDEGILIIGSGLTYHNMQGFREDHLLPLMVVAGAAGNDIGRRAFVDHVMGVAMASYRFG